MSEAKKTPIILKDIGSPNEIIGTVEPLLVKNDPQELIYILLDPSKYPNRMNDFPLDVRKYLMTHPRVKVEWQKDLPVVDAKGEHEYIDMTMVSVFYDAGINELRKVATRKAVQCWMKQSHLPKEMLFLELGFNGVFTFSKEDFP